LYLLFLAQSKYKHLIYVDLKMSFAPYIIDKTIVCNHFIET